MAEHLFSLPLDLIMLLFSWGPWAAPLPEYSLALYTGIDLEFGRTLATFGLALKFQIDVIIAMEGQNDQEIKRVVLTGVIFSYSGVFSGFVSVCLG